MADEQEAGPERKRPSPRSRYTASGVVAELLMLLETATEDGAISDQEAGELRTWLADNANLDVPGVELLRTTVNEILADGKVTWEERRELHKAAERVLPPEARRLARERRAAVENLEKARQRTEREELRAKRRAERDLLLPAASVNFMVKGVSYEGRAFAVEAYASVGDRVFLIRDRNSIHDRNAIAVRLGNGVQIGYLPREDALNLARFLDASFTHTASITKILEGRYAPIPVVQAYFYRPEAKIEGAVSEAEVPRTPTKAGQGCGCAAGTTIVLVFLGLLILMGVLSAMRTF